MNESDPVTLTQYGSSFCFMMFCTTKWLLKLRCIRLFAKSKPTMVRDLTCRLCEL